MRVEGFLEGGVEGEVQGLGVLYARGRREEAFWGGAAEGGLLACTRSDHVGELTVSKYIKY